MESSQFKFIAEEARKAIEGQLVSAGVLCRVFGRGKSDESLSKKLNKPGATYRAGGKLVQDAVGIRVVLYFSDDIEIARKIICHKFHIREADSMIDRPAGDEFTVTRYNLIFDFPPELVDSMKREIGGRLIDKTFEVQIRSVLSEGWHEVEHDLRYKQKNYWEGSDDLSRALNGIVATLETSEWGMKKIFEDLAYRHYKKQNWSAMLLLKLRMRLAGELDGCLIEIIDGCPEVGKSLLRINRSIIMESFAKMIPRPVLSINNVVYLWNAISMKNEQITAITPKLLLNEEPAPL